MTDEEYKTLLQERSPIEDEARALRKSLRDSPRVERSQDHDDIDARVRAAVQEAMSHIDQRIIAAIVEERKNQKAMRGELLDHVCEIVGEALGATASELEVKWTTALEKLGADLRALETELRSTRLPPAEPFELPSLRSMRRTN
jgi:hypothetical protein